jgi:hypothetical protein
MGFAYFLGAKFAGYTAFCHWVITPVLEKAGAKVRSSASTTPLGPVSESQPPPVPEWTIPSSVKAGVIRTVIGVAVGTVVGLSFWAIPYFARHDTVDSVLFFVFLVPVRVGEWALLLRWVYRLKPFNDYACMKLITFGILTSFALDAVGIISAFVLPGGMWVC